MRPVFIYALLDPRTKETRYVGQTDRPDKRLREHIRPSGQRRHYCANWIRSLGLPPIMEILDVVPDSEADFWETEYIQNFRERGFDLTNLADGGSTTRGVKCSPEKRAKLSASLTGKKLSPEHRAKISASGKGRNFSPEHRSNLSVAGKGRIFSPEHCAKISAARRAPEFRAKMSAALSGEKNPMFGKKWSPETRAKMLAARRK